MMPKLERLILQNGQFFDQRGRALDVQVLDLVMATAGTEPQLIFEGHQFPLGTNAFIQGLSFDQNDGSVNPAMTNYVAPTLCLRIKRRHRHG